MTGLPQPPTPPPPLTAEFENSANSGSQGASTQNWKMARGSSGQSAVGYGNKTVITNPNEQQVITLDHVKKEATVMPLPQAPGGLGGMIPGAPKAPSPQTPSSPTPPVQVTDLGKKLIAGHEAVGKLFTFKPPAPPQLPKLPGVNLPQMPKPAGGPPAPPTPPSASATSAQPPGGAPAQPPGGAPAAPSAAAPAAPKAPLPQMPHSVEVWTSPKLQLPLLTKSGSGASQQTTTCKQVTPGEPPSSAFQIPPGYKTIHPPSIPHLSSIPKASIPKPSIPKLPSPKLPGV
jgi:hypothetical protein